MKSRIIGIITVLIMAAGLLCSCSMADKTDDFGGIRVEYLSENEKEQWNKEHSRKESYHRNIERSMTDHNHHNTKTLGNVQPGFSASFSLICFS